MKLIAVSILAITTLAFAEVSLCGTEELLPIGFTEKELLRLDEIGWNTISTTPPPAGTVNPGEFAPATGIFVRWPLGLPLDLIVSISNSTTVWVICESYQQSSVENTFNSAGVNMDNVDYVFAPTNSIWIRDYGPWFVLLPDGSQGIFNYTYNRPRPDDNNFPVALGTDWGIAVYTSTIEQTGGNYMSSGMGTAMSTDLVYEENGWNEDWVDSQMELYLGIDNYFTMADPQSSYIDHIDCWGKLLSPGKILILKVPPSHEDYVALEAMADMFETQMSPNDRYWEVYRVESSGDEGYTNSLIYNDIVFMPTFNSDYDSPAALVYEEALPGYTVEGFYYYDWQPTDALHCRARDVMDREMLYLYHIPIDSMQTANLPVTIEAEIRCHPDNLLTSRKLFYRTETSGPFTEVTMSSGGGDVYTADIPGISAGNTVQYYIDASDNSGRNEQLPRFAPSSWTYDYETSSTGMEEEGELTPVIILTPPAPNPFSSAMSIRVSIDTGANIYMDVFDIAGRLVHTINGILDSGLNELVWIPEDEPSGIYIVVIGSGNNTVAHRVTYMRDGTR